MEGNIVERMSYHAFGERRTSDPLLPIIPALTNRGFTGHEHIDEMGFIHMNGRVYDPSIGRFLSADTYIQDPYNTQSYNRYSYVMNNPLKYTDPSGYWSWNPFKALKKAWRNVKKYGREIVAIAAAFYTGGATLAAGWGAWASGAAAGFVGGAIGTGSLKGAIQGAVLGAATAGIANHIGHGNSAFTKWAQKDLYNKAIAHGLSQGAISQISGGNFKSGFIGGSISSLSGSYMKGNRGESLGIGGRTAVAATAGGIAAELGGGKFANGARSAAFVHLFNAENLGGKIKSTYNGWASPTGAIIAGTGGMLAKIPHPYTQGAGYAMMGAGASLEAYDIRMSSEQNLGPNSAVIKTRDVIRDYYNRREEALRVIGN